MKKILILFFLSFLTFSFAQQNRRAFTIEIAANETQQYKAEIAEGPYFVKEKILQIYCGEKVFLECEIAGDSISTMKIVEKNINPQRTIEVKFSQDSEDRKNIITTLELNNPFDKDLVYLAVMLTPTSEEWKSTSTIPVGSKLVSFESWPYSIISFVLMNWQFKK